MHTEGGTAEVLRIIRHDVWRLRVSEHWSHHPRCYYHAHATEVGLLLSCNDPDSTATLCNFVGVLPVGQYTGLHKTLVHDFRMETSTPCSAVRR